MYGTGRPLGPMTLVSTTLQQDRECNSIAPTPLSKKGKEEEEAFEEHVHPASTGRKSRESHGSSIADFDPHPLPTYGGRPPARRARLTPSDSSTDISYRPSEATPIVRIGPTGKMKTRESSFKKKDYSYLRPLGSGAFGTVELHQHKRNGRLLALKTTRTPAIAYTDGIPSEIHIVRDILGNAHAHLPKLHHFTTHSLARIDYWMDYYDGGDLVHLSEYHHDRCSRNVPEGFIWHALTQLASALAFLHTGIDRSDPDKPRPTHWQPVIHRDIKPENVFLKLPPREPPTKDNAPNNNNKRKKKKILYPTLVLGDFGLATTQMTSGSPGHYIGTPAYQPPQLPIHTIYSDSWAIGAVTHFLALGCPPLAPRPLSSSLPLCDYDCDPNVREIGDVRAEGYSAGLQEYLCQWLCWEEEKRPLGLKGALRAEAGRFLWLADGGVEVGVEGWEEWVRGGGLVGEVEGWWGRGAKGGKEERMGGDGERVLVVRNP